MRRYHCGRSIRRTGSWQRQHGAVLDLDRRERRLAGVAPVDVAACRGRPGRPRAATRNSHCDQRYMTGSELMNARSQSNEKPSRSSCAGHVLGAALDPLARRHAAGDRAELGRQAERVEAEREQHVVAARAAEARVGVADRVAAHVADVDVARRERRRRLDVEVRPIRRRRQACVNASRSRQAACRRCLDRVRVVAPVDRLAHVDRA